MFETSSIIFWLFVGFSQAKDISSLLVPGNSVTDDGGVYLLKGEVSQSTGEDSWLLNGKTQNVDDMQFGLQVRAFASSTCGAVESFSATFDSYRIETQSDVVFTVSAGDKYFSVFSDWDGGIIMRESGTGTGGIFMYPPCSLNTKSFASLGKNENNANTLFNGIKWSTDYNDNWQELRKHLGQNNQFTLQTSDTIGYQKPFTISINNDISSDELTFTYTAGTFNYQCTFGDSFDPDTDIQINLTPDWDNEEWGVKSVKFDVECDEDFPTYQGEECTSCDGFGDSYFFNYLGSIDASKGNLIGSVSIGNQLELSFDMMLNEYPSSDNVWYSILHIGNENTERSPGYWFESNDNNSVKRMVIVMSDSDSWNTNVDIYPDDFKFELNKWYNLKLIICNGIVTHYINNKIYKSYSNAQITQRNDASIHVGHPWSAAAAPVTIKNLIIKPCIDYDTGCDYTHECKASGDPHIRSFDGTLYHFQGEGFFDYIKSCDNSLKLPFIISAKHYQCRSTRTCIGEVIVELDDGKIISFPQKGSPIFKNNGEDAIGSYSFFDDNSKLVEYDINKNTFEITFADNINQRASLKFYYKGTLLKVSTTDCLFGENNLCGLCGNINDDPQDDFKRCDNGEIVDNTGVSKGWSGKPWENTHIFGESCCNKDLDDKYIGNSDCGSVIEPPTPIDELCLLEGESICKNFYNSYCKICELDSNASDEWVDNCSFDMCADEKCQEWILEGGFTVEDGLNTKCLETSVGYCVDAFYSVLVDKAAKLGYEF